MFWEFLTLLFGAISFKMEDPMNTMIPRWIQKKFLTTNTSKPVIKPVNNNSCLDFSV